MNYKENKVENLKIAYIGGGSRGWAWKLMSDLALEQSLSGTVYLYDIDYAAAQNNEIIGNRIPQYHPEYDNFRYIATPDVKEALQGADFVVLSILPGTFEEMESDVHAPEQYGIYQAVGDTVGLGGIFRGLRTLPIYEKYALLIKEYCPKAWVINYTNPMTTCMDMLYKAFPEIKAVGCCHEVFGTQDLFINMLEDMKGITGVTREDIKVNVIGINHFTWLTEAKYKGMDLFPLYRAFCEKYKETGYSKVHANENWMNKYFETNQKVKMDIFLRYGYIAAAGDRHLAEFCPGNWYMKNPETVAKWGFALTPVSFRKDRAMGQIAQSRRLAAGEEAFEISPSGEKGVAQMKALLGLQDLITNVNIPNRGQIPNLPLGAVVETNAVFTTDSVTPVFAGEMPPALLGLTSRTVENQQLVVQAACEKCFEPAFKAFVNEVSNDLDLWESRELFEKMVENTREYLGMYTW